MSMPREGYLAMQSILTSDTLVKVLIESGADVDVLGGNYVSREEAVCFRQSRVLGDRTAAA